MNSNFDPETTRSLPAQPEPGSAAPKARGRGAGNPALTGKAVNASSGDTVKALLFDRNLRKLPKIDLMDLTQVEERIDLYFDACIKEDIRPGVAALAKALGIHRQRLWEIVTGNYVHPTMDKYPKDVVFAIRQAHSTMEVMLEYYMQNNKINPISGIFLLKNHFGYQDRQEITVSPNNQMGETQDPEELARKYARDALPGIAGLLPEGDSDSEK